MRGNNPQPRLSQELVTARQQVPRSSTGCIALESQVTPGHSSTAPTRLPAMQEVSKPVTSTNTASWLLSFSIITINQLSADRGSADEVRAPSRSFKDQQLPRNQRTPVTNSGHDVSAKPQGILLRISDSRIRLGSVSLHHGADVM